MASAKIDLDQIDRAMLIALQRDCRITNQELSERVGLSPSPCLRRLRRLEQGGVIQGYAARLDEMRVGLPVSVFVSVKLERQVEEALRTFETAIQDCPEVVDCWLMTGNRDYMLRLVVPDLLEYERFLSGTLTRIPGVSSIESSLSLRRVKTSSVLNIPGS
jgi:Lrp/AsnC family leucine-responsive transcriptional regulator